MAIPGPSFVRSLIAKHVATPRGRLAMSKKMTPSLRRFRDCSAVGRKAFLVENLEDGAAPVFVNGRDYADFRKFDRDVFDPITQQNLLRSGYVGTVYGMEIISSRVVPAGTIYICGEREFFGRIPIRCELTVISADLPW